MIDTYIGMQQDLMIWCMEEWHNGNRRKASIIANVQDRLYARHKKYLDKHYKDLSPAG